MNLTTNSYITLFLLLISLGVSAQDNLKATKSVQAANYVNAIELAKRMDSMSPVDELLNSKSITYPEFLAELYWFKAEFLRETIMATETVLPSELDVNEVFKSYDSVNKYVPCRHKLKSDIKKHDMLDHIRGWSNDTYDAMYNKSLDSLKQKGYKEEKEGVGLGFNYFVGKENWIGLNFTVFSFYRPTIRIKTVCDGKNYHYRDRNLSEDVLKFSYSHSLNTSKRDVSLSLYEVTAPIVLIPAKFGYVFSPYESESGFYYRPGIGVNIWLISLSYSYNFVLLLESRAFSETNLFGVGFSYPVVKRKHKKY